MAFGSQHKLLKSTKFKPFLPILIQGDSMKRKMFAVSFLSIVLSVSLSYAQEPQTRQRLSLDSGWRFRLIDPGDTAAVTTSPNGNGKPRARIDPQTTR